MLAKYLSADGKGFLALLTDDSWLNPLQLEHLLVAIHIGVSKGVPRTADLRNFVESLNQSESLGGSQCC